MKADRMRRRGSFLMVALVLGALLGACGTDSPSGGTTITVSGVVTAGTPTAGLTTCTSCHTSQTTDWQASRHGNMESRPSYTTNTFCAGCHDKTGDSQQLSPLRMVVGCEACHGGGALHVADGGSGPIGFTYYSAGVISGSVSSLAVSGQFLTCTGCHQLLDLNDPASTTTPTTLPQHSDDVNELITDTHFAKANTWSSLSGANTATGLYAVNGYAMNYASETVCTDCHQPHKSADINKEWAQSAHGDRYTAHKDPQGYFSGAWSYYNWSCDGSSTSGCGAFGTPSRRMTCQRCHTTSAFSAYADALKTGNSALAGQISAGVVSLVTYTAGFRPEMLKCAGCHSDNKGALRNPGAISADYSYATTTNNVTYKVSEASFAYPNIDKSNVCLACHTGLENGDTIKNLSLSTAPSITTMRNVGFINSHYLTGGGTVFTATGYEFDSRSYESPASYQHSSIGRNDFRSTGTGGPCVGCHMSRPNGNGNHLFLPVSRFNRVRYNAGTVSVTADNAVVTGTTTTWTTAGIDTAGDTFLGPDNRVYLIASVNNDTQITLTSPYRGSTAAGQVYVIAKEGKRIAGIASEICFNCHAGATSALVDQLNEERAMFEESLEALMVFLDKQGFCFIEVYPYFHKLRENTGTVNVTKGSTVVAGISTLFSTNSVSATTDRFRAADGIAYEIQSVDSDTQITLKTPYLGPSVSGSVYAIMISGSTNAVKDWDPTNRGGVYGNNNMGAAFNFNLLEHDPGAYVHNRMYVKRLIYDSIDWIDDNRMNYSTGTTLDTFCSAGSAPAWCAGAMPYLLPNGVMNGIAAERP